MEYVIQLGSPLRPIPSSRQRLTVATTAVSLTVPTTAIAGYARLETAQIRFTLDGEAPTSTTGQLLEIGETLDLQTRGELTGFQAIRTGGTSGVLDVEFSESLTAGNP